MAQHRRLKGEYVKSPVCGICGGPKGNQTMRRCRSCAIKNLELKYGNGRS